MLCRENSNDSKVMIAILLYEISIHRYIAISNLISNLIRNKIHK